MKLAAALLDKNEEADSIFTAIEHSYLQLVQKAKAFEHKPTVMTGIMYGDTWYIPGGKNYSSQFIADAGGHYIWSDDSSTKSLALGFENILTKAQQADLWIGTASIATYAALAQTDERYTYFKPYTNKKIYSYTKRVNEKGSNDYLESGYSRPDLILVDYIKMLHAESDAAKRIVFTYFSALE
jgi:iron complex transport system substrate-binding protein